jgi:hypothetical protein
MSLSGEHLAYMRSFECRSTVRCQEYDQSIKREPGQSMHRGNPGTVLRWPWLRFFRWGPGGARVRVGVRTGEERSRIQPPTGGSTREFHGREGHDEPQTVGRCADTTLGEQMSATEVAPQMDSNKTATQRAILFAEQSDDTLRRAAATRCLAEVHMRAKNFQKPVVRRFSQRPA